LDDWKENSEYNKLELFKQMHEVINNDCYFEDFELR